jgi:hypothetical protein
LTVAEAAEVLGITAEAVRSRIKRRTLHTIREGGTVYVVLSEATAGEATDRAQPVGDRARPGVDSPIDRTDALIDALSGQVEDLREQLHSERQAHAEARRLLAAALERIPAIEAPSETRESPETVERELERGERAPPQYPRCSGGRTAALVAEVVRRVITAHKEWRGKREGLGLDFIPIGSDHA